MYINSDRIKIKGFSWCIVHPRNKNANVHVRDTSSTLKMSP